MPHMAGRVREGAGEGSEFRARRGVRSTSRQPRGAWFATVPGSQADGSRTYGAGRLTRLFPPYGGWMVLCMLALVGDDR
jgi:hypothetical protein